jgi:NADH-quinone oxidoreductase subunit J
MVNTIFFYTFAFLTLVGAVLTITRRNAVYSAISLIVSLCGVAGLYLLQSAEFLFAVQIILYVGGVMVLFLFVIMLVNLDEAARQPQFNGQWLIALVCTLGVGGELAYFIMKGGTDFELAKVPDMVPSAGNTERIADVLFSQYLLPFEVASVMLLVAIVGSVIMAKRRF